MQPAAHEAEQDAEEADGDEQRHQRRDFAPDVDLHLAGRVAVGSLDALQVNPERFHLGGEFLISLLDGGELIGRGVCKRRAYIVLGRSLQADGIAHSLDGHASERTPESSRDAWGYRTYE